MSIASRKSDGLGIPALTVESEHLTGLAELLGADAAPLAHPTGHEVVQADPFPDRHRIHPGTQSDDRPSDLVPRHERQCIDRSGAGAVVDVRPTDSCSFDPNDYLPRPRHGIGQVDGSKWASRCSDGEGPHGAETTGSSDHRGVANVRTVNETFSNLFERSMERTVTIGGPNGSPAVKLKLLHAVAAAAAGILLAPRATAAAALAAMVKGVTITVDTPPTEAV
jgi:hypothetical protein